jgi:hypothetical protein
VENSQTLAELEEMYQDWQRTAETATSLLMNVEELEMQSDIIAEQIFRQSAEYSALFDIMTSLRADIELAAEAKSQTLKEKVEFQRQLMETNARLEHIDNAKTHLRQIRPQVTVLENTPTPLSRAVENKEIHVRLLGGRVAYVPLSELIEQLRGHIIEERHRYFRQRSSTGRVGPIDNFELHFLLMTYDVPAQGNFETRIELQHGEAVPLFEPLGRPVREALASPNSEFRQRLALFHSSIYTVTVWVYPDSFEEYRELKRFLQEHGYSVAARPMMMGVPIGVSPHGTRSSTQ